MYERKITALIEQTAVVKIHPRLVSTGRCTIKAVKYWLGLKGAQVLYSLKYIQGIEFT